MIKLSCEDYVAEVSTSGAIINSFSKSGTDIFFPRQEVDGSLRGGSHVCLPNFGPDNVTDQPQHGYGRVVEWDVAANNQTSVTLKYRKSGGDYDGLDSEIIYRLSNNGLRIELNLKNNGTTDMPVSPGFHPYFKVSPGVGVVKLNDESFTIADTEGTDWYSSLGFTRVQIGKNVIGIESDSLISLAIWSASPTNYICVEPTQAGNAHMGTQYSGALLGVGDEMSFHLDISLDDSERA